MDTDSATMSTKEAKPCEAQAAEVAAGEEEAEVEEDDDDDDDDDGDGDGVDDGDDAGEEGPFPFTVVIFTFMP